MNLNPNNPDNTNSPAPGTNEQAIEQAIDEALIDEALLDDALLDEALGQATPADLEAKILSLTDPQMLWLLDEALAPEPACDDLTRRILAATGAAGRPANGIGAIDGVGVLARIGPSTLRYASAAAIALAVGLGLWFANRDPVDTSSTFATKYNTPSVAEDHTAGDDPAWLSDEQYASSTNFFDNAIQSIESTLNGLTENIDDASITRDTLWAELDAYEQFLDDTES